MEDISKKIQNLEMKLSEMAKRQNSLSFDMQQIKNELAALKYLQKPASVLSTQTDASQPKKNMPPVEQNPVGAPLQAPMFTEQRQAQKNAHNKEILDVEKFIGENLISKIGIVVLIIGIAFGVKYSIDNDLISPAVRIMLGYLFGFALLVLGVKLKKKYENYSAVLVSGAIAITYFVTYSGYVFYNLLPQIPTFAIMFLLTVFAVFTAVQYNRQVIAHIGLVGAYAVPFLLSSGSDKAVVLFVYIAIINVGILAISYKKYWKQLYFSSFALTWLIYLTWYAFTYDKSTQFTVALAFLTTFFVIFYGIFLLYKLVKKEKYTIFDMALLLFNTFLFYGIGFGILNGNEATNNLLGLFTIANAFIHFIVGFAVYRQRLADKTLLYFIVALVFVFITIAIPVQLKGPWITLFWTAEACLLFIFGRIKNLSILEKISYPLMILAFFRLLINWGTTYYTTPDIPPFIFNIQFLTSMLFVGAFAAMCYVHFKPEYQKPSSDMLNVLIPAVLLFTLYFSIYLELKNHFETMWLLNYSLFFVSALLIFNILKLKNKKFGIITIILSTLFLFLFLTVGLYKLSELRDLYLHHTATIGNIIIRYISILFFGLTIFTLHRQIKQPYMPNLAVYFDCALYISLLWTASSELIHWLDMAGITAIYKTGLSVLWGAYALIMIVAGIWKKKKHIRFGSMALFGVTLLKLFFYDLSNLNTISKTIVMVILGVFLLLISFLYNKYKHIISD